MPWKRQIAEVDADRALQWFGAALAVGHLLTALAWRGPRDLGVMLSAGRPAICWPFFEACAETRVVSSEVWQVVPWLYGVAAVLVVLAFVRRRTSLAMTGLAVLTAVGLVVLLQDYRLRLNQHLMHNVAVLVFLVVPGKRRACQWIVVSFYFWAGTVKLTPDWFSGAALGPDGVPGVPASLVPAATAYVVALELVLVFGLFGPRKLGWAILAQLAVFHAMSWSIVGFFYPLLMTCLLAVFPLCWHFPTDAEPDPSKRGPLIAVALFGVLQLLPRLAPGDPAITSHARVLSLHMFDAHLICEAHMRVHATEGRTQTVRIPTDTGPMRMRCDPIVHWGVARHTCRSPKVEEVELYLESRRSTQSELRTVISLQDFCTRDPEFSLWSNDWIATD